MGARVLVTGGSGYLGSKLALEFRAIGYDVALLLRPSSNLSRLGTAKDHFTIGRCTTEDSIADFVAQVSPGIVVNTACSYGRHGESFLEISDANYRFGVCVAQAVLALQHHVDFINVGTTLPANLNAYAFTKWQFANAGQLLSTLHNDRFRFVNILLEHMYGPEDDAYKFTAHVFKILKSNQKSLELTAGTQRRDFVYIEDVVSALVTIAKKIEQFKSFENVEVGSGQAPTVREFVETVHALANSKVSLNFGAIPLRKSEIMYSCADVSRLQTIGWSPNFDIEAGITRTLEMETS